MIEETALSDINVNVVEKGISNLLPSFLKDTGSVRKKKSKLTPEAEWVKQNLKTKERIRSEDEEGNPNEEVKEVPCKYFGEIEFKGATRRAKAKFIQLSDTSNMDLVFELMTKKWNLEKPQLVISVTGGAKSFDLSSGLKKMFATGLRKVAQTPGAWVITGGTNTGVMKYVGEALVGCSKSLVGIAVWTIVTGKKLLRSIENIPFCGKYPYTVSSSLVGEGAFLDHNHSNFLLVKNIGEKRKGTYGDEINLRSRFEKHLMKSSAANVPAVLLVLEGGPNTVKTVYGACTEDPPVPVVVIKDSGRAADALAYAYNAADAINSWHKEHGLNQLYAPFETVIKNSFGETRPPKVKEIYADLVQVISRKQYITIFQMNGGRDVDEAILCAVLSSNNLPPGIQLRLTLLWNRADLAERFILSKTLNWKSQDLENALVIALALNRVPFVELLLNYCVSVNAVLTKNLIEFLYGYRTKSAESTLSYDMRSIKFSGIERNSKFYDTAKLLCGYSGQNLDSCCVPYDEIQRLVNNYCETFRKLGDENFIAVLATENDKIDYPYKELFFWAVLNNMHEMALFLWRMEEEGLAKALIAREINTALADSADKQDLAEEIRQNFLDNANVFNELSLKVLTECYSNSMEETQNVITSELIQFPGHTCLSLADAANQEEFISHSSVQLLLNGVWTGVIKTRDVSSRDILTAIFMPFLIFRFDFRSKDERMIKLEDVDEEEVEDIDETDGAKEDVPEDKEESRQVKKGENGSETQLISPSQSSQKNYQSVTPEKEQSKQPQEYSWFKKLLMFYGQVPVVKFYTNVISYFIFLGLFAYVAMLEKKDNKPGVAEWILVVWVVSIAAEEVHQITQINARHTLARCTEYIGSFWNKMDVVAVILFFVALGLRLNQNTVEYGHLLYAIDSWIWILRLLNVFYAHRILGPYVVMIGRMFIDMLYFISILVVFMVAYGVSTKAILSPQPSGPYMLRDVFFHPYFNIYGELFIDRDPGGPDQTRFGTPIINSYAEPITWALLGIYLLVANVLLLNLLIAIFGNTFETVQGKADQVWKFERYALVIEYSLRPSLVPPLILVEHIFMFLRFLYNRIWLCCSLGCRGVPAVSRNHLQITLTDQEKEAAIEFEMDCIANVLRSNVKDA